MVVLDFNEMVSFKLGRILHSHLMIESAFQAPDFSSIPSLNRVRSDPQSYRDLSR